MNKKKLKTVGLTEHSANPLTEQSKGPNQSLSNAPALLGEIRGLIESAREQTARAVNSTLVMMYWQIGQRIHSDGLHVEFGLSRKITVKLIMCRMHASKTILNRTALAEIQG